MKTLKFAAHLIPFIISGEKTSTWRIFDEKNLSLGDDLEFTSSQDGKTIGFGKIESLKEKKISEINEEDCAGHEKFQNTEEIITDLKKYYGDSVDGATIIKIIHFSFISI